MPRARTALTAGKPYLDGGGLAIVLRRVKGRPVPGALPIHTWSVRKGWKWFIAGVVVFGLLAAWHGIDGGAPISSNVPATLPTKLAVTAYRSVCDGTGLPDQPSWRAHGLVTVDPAPVGVTALWKSGVVYRPCQISKEGRGVATALGDGIRNSPLIPSGLINCPVGDGSQVILIFAYKGDGPLEFVMASVAGCRSIAAPGCGTQTGDVAFTSELERITPAGF